jgi:predicted  nucleic acid-binding Zn-ribbon protein
MADIDDVKKSVSELSRKIDRLEKMIEGMYREVGAREGRDLSQQIDVIERRSEEMKSEVDRIKIDTTQIRRIQEFGSKDMDEIKKALAAIYRNTDELERTLIPDERASFQ